MSFGQYGQIRQKWYFAYLGTPNMVKWGIPEKILQNAVKTLCQKDPPVKSYDQISFSADFPIIIIKKWPLYCPQGSGTLRQQLLMVHGIAWYCIVLHSIAWYCMVLHGIA